MYFPDPSFISFIREINTVLKQVINAKGLNKHGDELIKVCTSFTRTFRTVIQKHIVTEDAEHG